MQGLSARHRSFALDLWGFGDSSKLKPGYSLNAYVDMLGQFINYLGVARPLTLIGHGLGAVTTLKYAVKNPDHVDKLVSVSLPVAGEALDARLVEMNVDEFVARTFAKTQTFSEVDNELRKTDQEAVTKLAQEVRNIDFSNDLANCAMPVLVIYGENDPVVQPPANNNYLQMSAGNRHFVGLESCGHFPMLEAKNQFNRLIQEFIHSDGTVTELAPKEYWQRRVR